MKLEKRGGWVCLGVGVLALAVRAALLPLFPIPLPAVHDEFSYLLGAETFRLGRLANPPHPMWVHFETFHVNFQPTYASKYPPAQALFLALGWKLFGHPCWGVWLSCGAMCAALCWMLQGWVAPRYALLGGLMAAAQWGVAGYWVNSYWGGAVAAAAGALVVGAVPRLARRPAAGAAALAAVGVLGLANSRPYEGAVTAVAALGALLIWRKRHGRGIAELLAPRVLVAAGAILVCGFAAMGYYNYRVTGNPWVMPYTAHLKMYEAVPLFWFLPLHAAPTYHHEVLRRFWDEWDRSIYLGVRASPAGMLVVFALAVLPFFWPPLPAIAAFAAVFLRRSGKVRLALGITAMPVIGVLMEKSLWPHYFAPACGLMLLVSVLGVEYLGARLGWRVALVFAGLVLAGAVVQIARSRPYAPHGQFAARRQEILQRLEGLPGRQVAIVRYTANHDFHEEWVYNHADIDGSAVVWARDMGEAGNRELVDYYRGRKIWLLEADRPAAAPVPYAP